MSKPIYKSEKPYQEDINNLIEKGGEGSGKAGHQTTRDPDHYRHHKLMATASKAEHEHFKEMSSGFKEDGDNEMSKQYGHSAKQAKDDHKYHEDQAKKHHDPIKHGDIKSGEPELAHAQTYKMHYTTNQINRGKIPNGRNEEKDFGKSENCSLVDTGINDILEAEFLEKGRGRDKEPRAKRGEGIKKQPWDESVKDTPEYDLKLEDKKTAKIKAQLDAAKAEYKAKYGKDYESK